MHTMQNAIQTFVDLIAEGENSGESYSKNVTIGLIACIDKLVKDGNPKILFVYYLLRDNFITNYTELVTLYINTLFSKLSDTFEFSLKEYKSYIIDKLRLKNINEEYITGYNVEKTVESFQNISHYIENILSNSFKNLEDTENPYIYDTRKLTELANSNNATAQYWLGKYYFDNNKIDDAYTILSIAATQGERRSINVIRSIHRKTASAQQHTAETSKESYSQQSVFTSIRNKKINNKSTKDVFFFFLAVITVIIIIFSIARIDNQNTKIYSNSQDYYNLAVTHFNRMEYDKAFYFAEQAAAMGHLDANVLAGDMLYWGKGVKKDIPYALNMFLFAATQNSAFAMLMLGYHNLYIEKDYSEAFFWLKKSDEYNTPQASFYLGIMYIDGLQVKKSKKNAISHFKKSCNLGYEPACIELKKLHAN